MNDNLPSTAFGVVKLLPSNKEEVTRFAAQLSAAVHEGLVNPLEVAATLKMIEQVKKMFDAATKENQVLEAEKYNEKTFYAFGFEIQKGEVGVSYDYLSTGDPVYAERHAMASNADTLLKEREAFLRTLKEPTTIVHDQTGEVVTINPPLKKSTTGLKFTLK